MAWDDLKSRIADCWQRLLQADSPRASDGALETLLNTIEKQARRDPRCRQALTDDSFFRRMPDADAQRLLSAFGCAMDAWYRSDFPAAAEWFEEIEAMAEDSQRADRLGFAATALELSAISRRAACLTRQGSADSIETSLHLVRFAESRFDIEERPNCGGWLRFERARVAFWKDDVELARLKLSQADAYFAEADNRFGRGKVGGARARLNTHQGLYEAALDQLVWLRAWLDDDDGLSQAQTLYRSARVWRYREDYGRAVEVLGEALEFVKPLDNERWEAHIRDVLGDVYLLSGDLNNAQRQYGAAVFSRSRDPIVQARSRYRAAKLRFAQLSAANSPPPHRADWRRLIEECTELADSGLTQMIPQKARLLLGRIQDCQGDHAAAAGSFRRAASGFDRGRANWYLAAALYLAGQALLDAGQIAPAMQVMLAGLNRAVDRQQQQKFRKSLEHDFRDLDAAAVCGCIASLQEKAFHEAEISAIRERGAANLLAVLTDLNGRLTRPPAILAHVRKELQQLGLLYRADTLPAAADPVQLDQLRADMSGFWTPDTANELIQDSARRQAEMFQILGAALGEAGAANSFAAEQARLLHFAGTHTDETQWMAVADLAAHLDLADSDQSEIGELIRTPTFGVLADPDAIHDSLTALKHFMSGWVQSLECGVQLDRNRRWLRFRFSGLRPEAPHDTLRTLFSSSHYHRDLEACGLDGQQWAAAVAAALPIEAIGGKVRIGPAADAEDDRLKSLLEYCLDVDLPAEEIPPWVLPVDEGDHAMKDDQPIDVLIFEDTAGETDRIVEEMGLEGAAGEELDPAGAARPDSRRRYRGRGQRASGLKAADSMQRRIENKIAETDPKVVVFDWLLSGDSGEEPYNGLEFGKQCKAKWPQMGVVLVTTGGDGALEGTITAQQELDKQKDDNDWPIDCAWIKPWGPAGRNDTANGVELPDWCESTGQLIEQARRPSEH